MKGEVGGDVLVKRKDTEGKWVDNRCGVEWRGWYRSDIDYILNWGRGGKKI